MWINLSGFKVVHGEKVLRALALSNVVFDGDFFPRECNITKPQFLEILVLNEDGNVVSIYDEAWKFQFIQIVWRA